MKTLFWPATPQRSSHLQLCPAIKIIKECHSFDKICRINFHFVIYIYIYIKLNNVQFLAQTDRFAS